MDALLKYWRDFNDWCIESEQQHLAECEDPECDARVCRAARGLPPLTEAEIKAGKKPSRALKAHVIGCNDPNCSRECVELRARLEACGDPDCQNAIQCLWADRCQAECRSHR
jgi:hypothetical protein